MPLWFATVYATARAVYRKSSMGRARQLEAMADRLASVASGLIAESALPSPPRGRLPGA